MFLYREKRGEKVKVEHDVAMIQTLLSRRHVTQSHKAKKCGNEMMLKLFNLEPFPPNSLGGYGGLRTHHAVCVV